MGQWMYYYPVTQAELDALLSKPSSAYDFLFTDEMWNRAFHTEQTWEAIDCLLRGTFPKEPHLGNVIYGGTEIEGTDIDTSVRYFTPSEVKKIAASLLKVTDDELLSVYDPQQMNELCIRPMRWGEDPEFDREYITDWFKSLVDGFSKAAQNNQVVLVRLAL